MLRRMNFLYLPSDIHVLIADQLDALDVFVMTRTCLLYRHLFQKDIDLWNIDASCACRHARLAILARLVEPERASASAAATTGRCLVGKEVRPCSLIVSFYRKLSNAHTESEWFLYGLPP